MLGHDRTRPFEDYCVGLLSAEGRKSVEPLSVVTAPQRTAAQHKSLLDLVGPVPWSDQAIFPRCVSGFCLASPAMSRSRPGSSTTPAIRRRAIAWSVWHRSIAASWAAGQLPGGGEPVGGDPSGQPAGRLSAVSAKGWAENTERRAKAGVPKNVVFQTKPEIALQQMLQMLASGVPSAVALADPAYGNDGEFRVRITELGLFYVMGLLSSTTVWRPGEECPKPDLLLEFEIIALDPPTELGQSGHAPEGDVSRLGG